MGKPEDKIIIYQSELDYLSKCILDSPRIETGGNLFGLWTPFGIPFIQYVVGPGPEAIHNPTHFRQDFKFLDRNADLLVGEHALHHIGTWHSHHSLSLSHPSYGDTESTLSGMKECRLPSFILLIGNYRHGKSSLNAFRYFSDGTMNRLKWVILNGTSPIREVYDKVHPEQVHIPSAEADMLPLECGELMEKEGRPPQFSDDYWLSSKDNRKEFAAMIKYLKTRYEAVGIFQLDASTVELRIEGSSGAFSVILDSGFPDLPPKLHTSEEALRNIPEWDTGGGSISETFINFINTTEL